MDPVGVPDLSTSVLAELGFDLCLVVDCVSKLVVDMNDAASEALHVHDLPVALRDIIEHRSVNRLFSVVTPLLGAGDTWTGTLQSVRPPHRPTRIRAFLSSRESHEGRCLRADMWARVIDDAPDLLSDLAYRATHEPLTGLPNRTLLLDRLQQALARGRRNLTATAVMFIDLDGFKNVNDEHGHEVGDEVLVGVATRMQAALRPTDTLARLGGDEFVAMCPDIGDPLVAEQLRSRLDRAISTPTGPASGLSASIGLAVEVGGARSAAAILSEADRSMYEAKRLRSAPAGGHDAPTRFATPHITSRSPGTPPRPYLVPIDTPLPPSNPTTRIARMIAFDPVVDLFTGEVIQLDAHFLDGVDAAVSADAVVECAELAVELVEGLGAAAPTISVPVTEPDVDEAIEHIRQAIDDNPWLPPNALCVDMGESLATSIHRLGLQTLHQLAASGIPVVIDDFSRPSSTRADLLELSARMVRTPLTARSESFPDGPPSAAITAFRELLSSAAQTNTTVVALGIANEADAERARANGCRYGQGALFGVHLSEAECLELLKL